MVIAAVAIVAAMGLVAWCLWLDDRRRRDRDADLIGEVRRGANAVEAAVAELRWQQPVDLEPHVAELRDIAARFAAVTDRRDVLYPDQIIQETE